MEPEIVYVISECKNKRWYDFVQCGYHVTAKEIYEFYCSKFPNNKYRLVEKCTKTIVEFETVLTNENEA
jgi:hypothetical protein